MNQQRSASINCRQSIGILIFEFGIVLGFSSLFSLLFNIIRIFAQVQAEHLVPQLIGTFVGVLIFVHLSFGILGISLNLMNDPKGFDWKSLKKG